MSDKPKTAAEWLGLGDDDIFPELQKALSGLKEISWNTAMEWRDKIKDASASRQEIILFMQDIANHAIENSIKSIQSLYSWWQWNAQPKDWLILIVLAEGAKS